MNLHFSILLYVYLPPFLPPLPLPTKDNRMASLTRNESKHSGTHWGTRNGWYAVLFNEVLVNVQCVFFHKRWAYVAPMHLWGEDYREDLIIESSGDCCVIQFTFCVSEICYFFFFFPMFPNPYQWIFIFLFF